MILTVYLLEIFMLTLQKLCSSSFEKSFVLRRSYVKG